MSSTGLKMTEHGKRKFYHVPEGTTDLSQGKPSIDYYQDSKGILEMIRNNVMGGDTVFRGPFGPRKSCYMDTTASGQSLKCIEDYMQNVVMPYYGNTHTTSTATASQTTLFRDEARDIIRNCVGASEHDAVIFCGSGTTACVHKLVGAITGKGNRPPPIVFIGPHEHHSNMLPWRECGARVINVPENKEGGFDLEYLEGELRKAKLTQLPDQLLVGSFNAVSNVTGIAVDDIAITILMHKYGGLCFWDYAAAASHLEICMNPIVTEPNLLGLARKDALYFSGHKLTPQTPGVLIVKKNVLENPVPHDCGGGTVFFVTNDSHRYLKNPEHREEGGTPSILESIRLGLFFRLKSSIAKEYIVMRDLSFINKAFTRWSSVPEIETLGMNSRPRIATVSLMIRHPESGYYLHYNYVVALLNDLFGIQTRGGCACAGPYGQYLLGISTQLAHDYESLLLEDSRLNRTHIRKQIEGSHYELFRPGFIRISAPFYASDEEEDFVIEAVEMIAKWGYKLLPMYVCNPETGEFHHHASKVHQDRKWLSLAKINGDGIAFTQNVPNDEEAPKFKECLKLAQAIFDDAEKLSRRRMLADQSPMCSDEWEKSLKWFLLPHEAAQFLNANVNSQVNHIRSQQPFRVRTYEKISLSKTNFFVGSIAHQLLRKSEDDVKAVHEASVLSPDSECQTPALDVPGVTVTGPSICFNFSQLRSLSEDDKAVLSQTPPKGSVNSQITYTRPVSNGTIDKQSISSSFSQCVETTPEKPGQNDNQKVQQHTNVKTMNETPGLSGDAPIEQSPVLIPQDSPISVGNFSFTAPASPGNVNCAHSNGQLLQRQNVSNGFHPQNQIILYNPQTFIPRTPESLPLSSSSNSLSFNRDSESPVTSEEIVHSTMRRVTHEIANELKSELRGVINQMELGMDLDSSRERSSSFNSNGNQKDAMKRRARTLSGDVFSPRRNFKTRLPSGLNEDCYGESGVLNELTTKLSSHSSSENLCLESLEQDFNEQNPDARDGTSKLFPDSLTIEPTSGTGNWRHPPKSIINPTLKAVREFQMLRDGDKVLVCLSGGKDSLSLLHVMKQLQHILAKESVHFSFGAVTVDPKHSGFNPKPLIPYVNSLGIPYFFEEQGIMPTALEKAEVSSFCSFCSRLKRGRLYHCARTNGYNVLAFGQHLDDMAESFFMSVFHNGLLRTMKASYTVKEEDLRVIRPFAFVRENALRQFAESKCLPVIPENCPACFEAPTERQRVKQLLAHQELLYPKIFVSIRAALYPLMAINKTGQESKKKHHLGKQA